MKSEIVSGGAFCRDNLFMYDISHLSSGKMVFNGAMVHFF